MLEETKRYESVYVEEIPHGNSDKISRTCLLLNTGASEPALRTGRPVMGSRRMRTFSERVLRGVSTIRPPSTSAFSGSPLRSPSWRRMGLGRTTLPLVETRVRLVGQPYPLSLPAETARKLAAQMQAAELARGSGATNDSLVHGRPVRARTADLHRVKVAL